jgi:methylated-DNA-protein-cysteine methyltransferase-like protein
MDARLELIRDVILRVPPGRVATYGQIAEWTGLPRHARLVARALRDTPPDNVLPWHRILGAGGRIRIPDPRGAALQRELLEAEGVLVEGLRVDLGRFGWRP